MSDYLSVSQLTKYLKLKFDRDPYLERVYLTGQVSNFRKRPNHQYFSLKDEGAVIQATIWGGIYKKLGFDLEEGMKVNIVGRVQLYEPSGSYSIIIEKVEPDGVGALALQFEQLKAKLSKEGYFNDNHKQALPQFSRKIGVVTSPSGAVIKDIITTVSRRFPGVDILLFPTKVQGNGAAEEVAANIALANQRTDLDLLIVGRGGGSIEDLWAFNEEIVVQAIFESHLPIISSVGHETDITLADFVADRRAATPTAAAELATPVTKADIISWISEQQNRAYQANLRLLKQKGDRLAKLSQSVIFRQPERLYDGFLQKIDRLQSQLTYQAKQKLSESQHLEVSLRHRLQSLDIVTKLSRYQEKMNYINQRLQINMQKRYDHALARFEKAQDTLLALDTERIIARGYGILRKDEEVISSVTSIAVGDALDLELQDGQIEVEVKNVKQKTNI
ncbi:exodeoxyribonuclease VII large subunit [Streptococcus pseudoporcinus]|uniref:Exodeoxyribonuclease 7 large subunit n=1 Tax=Streptococcus pseudoporcinus LQ 940-04 TaxID=875093 RepID=G5K903_9STRE|nr:exodeoxyribonuclease VII large subunit [Streptococcus pseudoporcinus]EFR43972.1 exodeoxyribonuclease VII, large subunit [Streptococcus pseudoporcinus SPIN 20026]EHI65197.1 exodeoxyribonuclease VII, large subunit [Streptococcus pseudoporcinus LQ 940-04]VEF93406.1 exodeoxyribonuclease VII large subunit [Streptococcus pseudoporcinus]